MPRRKREEDDQQFMLALYAPDVEEPDEPPEPEPGAFDMTDLSGWKPPSEWTLQPGEMPEDAIREYLNFWYGRRIR